MTVKELIAHLQQFDENLGVVTALYDDDGTLFTVAKPEPDDFAAKQGGKYLIMFDYENTSQEMIEEYLGL